MPAKVPAAVGTLPVVAIVGRPNVGKSALFNRLIGRRKALVEEERGTTRDRVYGDVEWRDTRFRVVDTGGLEPDSAAGYAALVRQQIEFALDEASVIVFVVDARTGITVADEEVAELLRRSEKPVFLVANKVDNEERREAAVQFYELGLGEPVLVSAQHSTGLSDLLDRVHLVLPPQDFAEAISAPRLAIVGRPNVGKSMLLNAILGEERVIVSEQPGTTRDAVDTAFDFEGSPVVLIDTAGLRRRGKIERGLERHSTARAREALERADTALVVYDAADGVTAQDLHVAGYALDAKTGVVVVANKIDLLSEKPAAEIEESARMRLRFAPWAAFAAVSAKERTGIDSLLRRALEVCQERERRIETSLLNRVIEDAIATQTPPPVKNRTPKFLYVTQPSVAPPTFVFFVNDARIVHFSYRRYLENVIRQRFGFEGTAIRLVFRSREER
jgi:GTPase